MLFSIVDSSCASAPCCNGGICRNDGSSFKCTCPAGFTGDRCEMEGNFSLLYLLLLLLLLFSLIYREQLPRYEIEINLNSSGRVLFFSYVELCQIPYLFFSTSSGTLFYNAQDSNPSPSMVNDDIDNAFLSFDGINKRLYLYTNKMVSYKLDGSDQTEIDIDNVEFFAVDGRNNLIYYHHERKDEIYVYDIGSGENGPVAALSGITSAKDMEVDMRNGYVTIL